MNAFLNATEFWKNNDDGQVSVSNLCDKMQKYLRGSNEQAYTVKYMKAKLLEYTLEK